MAWAQPPGAPFVGEALLEAYACAGDPYYLDAALKAGDFLLLAAYVAQ